MSAFRVRLNGRRLAITTLLIALFSTALVVLPTQKAAAACTGNAIVCENQLAGTPESTWDPGSDDKTVLGFTTQASVNAGSTVSFKVNSAGKAYTMDIYRLGWYQGNGARKITSLTTTAQTQPACASDNTTEIYDCGTWKVGATWTVPSTSVSGVYVARVTLSNKDASLIPFVVRNDGNISAVVMKTSDATWQAYNLYGGNDFYSGGAHGRAYKLSYNRPYIDRNGTEARDYLFSNEAPMIRFLEQNGYDVSYITDIDASTDASQLTKHKTFLSVGHDEYWSSSERANVTAARDAGVNLAFFSGNEVYWKTRLEASQDGTNTANRTLVCYKDSWASDDAGSTVTIDPGPGGPTPTWRDPRYGDLGFPAENQLTGTMYVSNSDDLALTVGATEGKLRVWRNTGLDSMSGSSTVLADHTIGYESDEDVDNGYRPAGLIDMSTTVGDSPQIVQGYGKMVAPGTTTHHITEYRAASGALVFSAGTIQWSWGLDSDHDGDDVQAADPRIRQATVNILADMSATATTPASDITVATKSTDTTPPVVSVIAPTNGTVMPEGSLITVKGTASDADGKVAGVEVSTDGGATWHPASGTTNWSYTDILSSLGPTAVEVRATDDSANTSAVTALQVGSTCPCSIFGVISPALPDSADNAAVSLGVKFTSAAAGYISGVRFYKSDANTGAHTGSLWTADGKTRLATGAFTNETANGWQTMQFAKPVAIAANTTYVASYYAPNGHYAAAKGFFDGRSQSAAGLTAPGGAGKINGVYANGDAFPSQTYKQTNYYVDVVYSASNDFPTTVTATSPSAGATSVLPSSSVTATFSVDVGASSVTMALQDPNGNAVPGAVSYSSASQTATFNPTQALATGTAYTATVGGAKLGAPYQWTFTTATADSDGTTCPCTLFDDSDHPAAVAADDAANVQLGMAFTVSSNGLISGGRYYKNDGNTGTHSVSLWDGSTQLATGVDTNETASGWQSVTFKTPVSVTTGKTYVISYTATQGNYGYTRNGLSSSLTKGAISSVANGGRYNYGSGALTSTSATNYFVDPIYGPSANTPPTIASSDPDDGATGVAVDAIISVMFNADVQSGSGTYTLTRKSDGSAIPGSSSSESSGSTVSFVPAADLDPSTAYTLTVSGVKNAAGMTMTSAQSISFTTAGAAKCPCSVFDSKAAPNLSDSGDTDAVTLGMKFSSSVAGTVTGLRYYRDAANTGSHTGTLWAADGTTLATVAFTDKGTGWQTATFSSPVPISANTTYVAGYYAPSGHYSADVHYFDTPAVNTPLTGNGSLYSYSRNFPTSSFMASNYYVDVLFTTTSTGAPSVTLVTPDDGSYVGTDTAPTATFSTGIDPTSLSMSVTAADGTLVSGSATYDATSKTATFTPASALAQSTAYTVSVDANSAGGVAMDSPKTWSFTTKGPAPTGTAYSLFANTATPANASWNDNGPVLVGVRFSSANAGSVTALEYYGSAANSGTHKLYLWDNNQNLLATATSTDTTVGWRSVTLDNPVAIKANTTYVVGVYDPNGHYAVTTQTYANPYTAGPLSVPANGATYNYPNGFPTATSTANYWVDVVVVS